MLPTPAPAPVVDTDGNSFAADLPERPSPDGGEDHMPTSHDETESWPDWDFPDNTVSYSVLAAIFVVVDTVLGMLYAEKTSGSHIYVSL